MSRAVSRRLIVLSLSLALALPLTGCGAGGGSSALETPAYLPPDAFVAGTVRFDSLAEGLDTALGMLRSVVPPEEFPEIDQEIAQFEEKLGFRLREDLLDLVSREASFALGIESIDLLAGQMMGGALAGKGGLPPGFLEIFQDVVAVMGISDIERLDESLSALLALADGELRISEDGLRTAHAPAEDFPLNLYYRHHGGFVVLGLAASAVDRAIARAEEGTGLDHSGDFRALLERLGSDPVGFSYVNLPRIHEALEGSATVQGAVALEETGQRFYRAVVPEEPWSAGQAWGIYRVEDGIMTRSFVPRDAYPLPGAFLGNLGSVQMVGVMAAIAVPNFLNALDREKQKRTMTDLRAIGIACEEYAIDNNVYPGPTRGLVAVDWLSSHVIPVYSESLPLADGWGESFLFWSDGGRYVILSRGKDGEQDWFLGSGATGATTSFDADIVYDSGTFIQVPKGKQY